jgi:hypothetical protein
MSDYFVALNNMQQGPFPAHELVARGMRPESLVWREGMGQWQRADSIPELAGLFAPPAVAERQVGSQQMPPAQHLGVQPAPQWMGYARPYAGLPTSGAAIASMVLGIVSLVFCMGWLIIPCAILAIILGGTARGAVRRGEASGGGMALAGIICGAISLCIILLLTVMFATLGFHAGARLFRFFPR